MPYADFSMEVVTERFGLQLHTGILFPDLPRASASDWLAQTLSQGRALALGSEKARSEFIIAPVLLEVRALTGNRISIYSGQRFDVDASLGLVGECDFILAETEPLPIVQSPLVSVIEAKKGDVEQGLGQCVAQMVGAQRFNLRDDPAATTVFGCVTTADVWQFLRLTGNSVTFDHPRLFLGDLERILGTFVAMVSGASGDVHPLSSARA